MSEFVAQWSSWFSQTGAGRWFYGREHSERRIIALLAAAIVLTLLWLLLWKPVADWRAVTHNRYENAQASLSWLQANEQKAKASASNSAGGGERSVMRVITQAANARNLKLSRVQPEGDEGVSVVLQDQPFTDVLLFVAQLAENNGVRVTRAAIDGSGTPGRVNAQVRFR
ncbi:MAG: type II secretion system protein GspM [Pseudomonadales bacterium]